MAILSSYHVITGLSLFHLAMAFYFLTSPRVLADQNVVFVLGEAMGIPQPPTSFMNPNAMAAFSSLLLGFIGISDLVAASQPEEVTRWHWSTQAPVRLFFFMVLAIYTYLIQPEEFRMKAKADAPANLLKNSFIFTWAFLEMFMWFYIYVTVREEKGTITKRMAEKAKSDEDID